MALNVVRFILNFGNESRLTSIPVITSDGEKRLSFASLADKIKQKYFKSMTEYKISCQLKQGQRIRILDDEDLYLAVESMQGFDGETCVLDLSVKSEVVISSANSTDINESIIDIIESVDSNEIIAPIKANSLIAVSNSNSPPINEPSPFSGTEIDSSSSHRNKRSRTESLSNHTSASSISVNEIFSYIIKHIFSCTFSCLEYYLQWKWWAIIGPSDAGILAGERVASTQRI